MSYMFSAIHAAFEWRVTSFRASEMLLQVANWFRHILHEFSLETFSMWANAVFPHTCTQRYWSSLLWFQTLEHSNNVCSSYQRYTLSHPENDRDVTERVQEYTLQDASFMRQSRTSFACDDKNTADVTVVLEVRQSIVRLCCDLTVEQ